MFNFVISCTWVITIRPSSRGSCLTQIICYKYLLKDSCLFPFILTSLRQLPVFSVRTDSVNTINDDKLLFLGFSFFNIIINLWVFFTYRISFSQLQSLFSLTLEFLYLNYGWPFSLVPVSSDTISLILGKQYIQTRLTMCLPAHIWINHISLKSLVSGNVFRN